MKTGYSNVLKFKYPGAPKTGRENLILPAPRSFAEISFDAIPLYNGASIHINPGGNYWRENYNAERIVLMVRDIADASQVREIELLKPKRSQRLDLVKTLVNLKYGRNYAVKFRIECAANFENYESNEIEFSPLAKGAIFLMP